MPGHRDPGMRQEGLESPQGTALLPFNWATLLKVVALGTSQLSQTGQPRGRPKEVRAGEALRHHRSHHPQNLHF